MIAIPNERLRERARENVMGLELAVTQTAFADSRAELEEELELARIALASLNAEPYGYLRENDWQIEISIGPERPNNRSGGYATPWAVIYAAPPAPVSVPDDYFSSLVAAARVRADKAMRKFPQPNYVLNKVAEESGEVIKAVIHFTEGREEWRNVEGEIIDNLAMLIRLVMEGDQVIGFTPPDACRAAMLQGAEPVSNRDELPDGWVACSERMPERDVDVQVYCADKKEQMVGYMERNEQGGYFRFASLPNGGGVYCKPTHWMPLPAAPQQEAE